MIEDRLHTIHDVTDNFFFWQGLRWIPMGAAMVACAAVSSPRLPVPPVQRGWIAGLAFAAALWLSTTVLGGYYTRQFGRVRGDPSRHSLRTSLKWLVAYPALCVALVIDATRAPQVSVSSLAFAIALEAYRQSTGGRRVHYRWAAIGLVAFSTLPAFGLASPGKGILAPLIGVIGFIYVVGGLLDHRELLRILASVQEEPDVSSI
jgi:hypothetical protein